MTLGVHGRFDLRVVSDGLVLIEDFKTGCVNGDLEKLGKWKKQVAIYALISWRATNGKPHSGRIVAADGVFDVHLDERVFEDLTNELLENKKRWPEHATSAADLGILSAECRACPVRHVCPRYLSQCPWKSGGLIDEEPPKNWSWDVWGAVARISTSGNSLVIQSPDDTRVIVNNLPAIPRNLDIGNKIGLFGLWRARNHTPQRPVLQWPACLLNVPPPRLLVKQDD